MILRGGGQAWIDDVSLEIVEKGIASTAKKTLMSQLGPGLFEIRGGTEYEYRPSTLSKFAEKLGFGSQAKLQKDQRLAIDLLIPLPLSYRKQVPVTYELAVTPPDAANDVTVYQDTDNNHVVRLKLTLTERQPKAEFGFRSLVLVGPAEFQDVPEQIAFPDEWPEQCQPWLASTWCVESENEQIQAFAQEIVTDTDDVMAVIGRVEKRASEIFADAEGMGRNLTAVEALRKRGSCTSCANLVAAMLRACNIPARVVAGYPSWSGPLQTHYIVEAFVPDFGWYPIESTLGRSPWPNTHQVNVAIVPPEYERQDVARYRPWVAGGVPYLSLTEIVDPPSNVTPHGTVNWDRNCDHHCQLLREFSAREAQWTSALALAKSRWQSWVASEPEFHKPGKLVFHDAVGASEAATLPELMEVLARETVGAQPHNSAPQPR
jgi:transglutaminase-like putative cysteine protease